jgi:hypothetical protein
VTRRLPVAGVSWCPEHGVGQWLSPGEVRSADDLQHRGRRRLTVQRIGEFLFQVGVGCAKAAVAMSLLAASVE